MNVNRKPQTVNRLVFLLLLLLASPLIDVDAQVPRLNGKRYMPSLIVRDPFIVTNYMNTLGFGQATSSVLPKIEIPGVDTIAETRADLLFFRLEFQFDYAVKEWLSFHSRLGAVGRVGTSTASLLSQGVTAATGYELGWVLRALRTEQHQLSVGVQMVKYNATIMDIGGFIRQAVEDGEVTKYNKVMREVPILGVTVDGRYAWSFNEVLGLAANIEALLADKVEDEQNSWRFRGGVALDADFEPMGVPLGVMLGAGGSSIPVTGVEVEEPSLQFVGALYYTGMQDFTIGLNLSYESVPENAQTKAISVINANLNMKYFFP
jgi:hypothetical protein